MTVKHFSIYNSNYRYHLKDFTPQEMVRAKEFLKKALIGFFTIKADEIISEWIEELKDRSFGSADEFSLDYTIRTLGNDLLAAVGAARNELEDQHGDAKRNHDVENIQTESLAELSSGTNFPGRYNP